MFISDCFNLCQYLTKNKVSGHIKQCLCKTEPKKPSGANPLTTNTAGDGFRQIVLIGTADVPPEFGSIPMRVGSNIVRVKKAPE